MNHKCNKCLNQAFTKFEKSHIEYCLRMDMPIKDIVKTCSLFQDPEDIDEPDLFEENLDELFKNPTNRKINNLRKQIEELRSWGRKKNKIKMRNSDMKHD